MSLASEYAARQTAVRAQFVSTDASVPPRFHCDSCDAQVEIDGTCSITPGTGTGAVVLTERDANSLSDWITATFR